MAQEPPDRRPPPGLPAPGPNRRTKAEQEDAIAQAVIRAHKAGFGRGPVQARAYLLDGLALVHVRHFLTTAEALVARRDPAAVTDFRRRALDPGLGPLTEAVAAAAGRPVRAVLTDVAPGDDEAVLVFSFAPAPLEPRPP